MGASFVLLARARAIPRPALPLAIAAMLLLASAAEAGQGPDRTVQVDGVVNVRAGRGTAFPQVDRLLPGKTLLARDCVEDWCAVARADTPGVRLGYVFAPLLKPRAETLAVANPVAGTEITLTPSLRTAVITDSNVMFQDISDQVVQVSPQLEGKLLTERTTLTARAGAEVLRHARYDEFDRMNREFSLGQRHSLSETARVELNGRARYDHTFESALAESGEVAKKSPHRRYSLSPALVYRLDERTEARLAGEAVANQYPENPQNDAHTRSGTLDLAHALDHDLTLLGRTGFTTASYNRGSQDTATLGAGAEWKLTETLSCLLLAGPSLSRDLFAEPVGGGRHLDLAGEARLRLALERAEAELGGDLGTVSGQSGEDTRRRRITGRTAVHLTERLDITLAAAWFRSRSRALVQGLDNTVVQLNPGLRYALGEYVSLSLDYGYTCIDDHRADVYRQRQQIALFLHLEYPRMLR